MSDEAKRLLTCSHIETKFDLNESDSNIQMTIQKDLGRAEIPFKL